MIRVRKHSSGTGDDTAPGAGPGGGAVDTINAVSTVDAVGPVGTADAVPLVDPAQRDVLAGGEATPEIEVYGPPENFDVPVVSSAEREPAPPLPSGKLTPDRVPEAPKPQPMPLIRALMPLVMVIMVVAMVGLMVFSGGPLNPTVLIFPLMMAASLLMMLSPPQGEDTDETRRVYVRHLSALRDKALKNAQAQRRHEEFKNPAPEDLFALLDTPRMWERAADSPDTLAIRVGTGRAPLCTPVHVEDSGSPEDLDPVCAISLRHTVRAISTVPDMPIVVQMQAFPVIGLTGPKAAGLARAIVASLVVHHGPETVGIATLGLGFDWCKWLPHIANPQAATMSILVVDDTIDADQALLNGDYTCIISVGLREGTALAQWAENEGIVFEAGQELATSTEAGTEILGVPDQLDGQAALALARSLAKYRRPDSKAAHSSDLRRLLGVDELDQWNVAKLWQPRGARRLAVPIGLNHNGAPMILDIKESAHGGMGPHGLCIGATGSGKSELLRTLVVAMAATHSPDDINFVLVDFKGGATFLGLDGLPHTAAVITNLEEESALVDRMHDAIAGEMNRRQELLRKAGNFANVTDYSRARELDPTMEPLPALFIVLDEFSELLGHHPDFAELFVAVGRLGRSLHIHLLLASQRLEEGRLRGLDSHLSYRFGLKTFSAAESRQVLGVTDAYHLPSQPGSGYLKTDAEHITRFRASYISGPLTHRTQQVSGTGQVRVFDSWAHDAQLCAAEATDVVVDPRGRTLVDEVVEATTAVATQRNMRAHPIWLPPLPAELALAGVVENHGFLVAAVGIIDRPYQQRQDVLTLDFHGQSGHAAICGGPQTGKTNALRCLVISMAVTHSTSDIRFYVLDLAGSELVRLQDLAHVAGCATKHEPEKVRRIVDEVTGLIAQPESRHTFLIVDGWHVVTAEFEDLVDKLSAIAADGLAARVHLVCTTPRWTALRPAVRDLITTRIELKLGEAMDSLIDRKLQQKLPAKPGQALIFSRETSLFCLSGPQDIAHAAQVTAHMDPVPALKLLPQRLSLPTLRGLAQDPEGNPSDPIATKQLLLGIGGPQLAPMRWDFHRLSHILCFGGQGSGKSNFVRLLAQQVTGLDREQARIVMIDHRRAHLGALPEHMVASYSAGAASTETTLKDTVHTLSQRLPGPEITPAQLAARSWWEGPEIFLIIDDLDLVPDHALHQLREILPHSRDVGLHVIAARKSGGVQRALYQPFLAELRDQSPTVVILDADKEDGPLFGLRTTHREPGRGALVERGVDRGLIQLALAEDEAASSNSRPESSSPQPERP